MTAWASLLVLLTCALSSAALTTPHLRVRQETKSDSTSVCSSGTEPTLVALSSLVVGANQTLELSKFACVAPTNTVDAMSKCGGGEGSWGWFEGMFWWFSPNADCTSKLKADVVPPGALAATRTVTVTRTVTSTRTTTATLTRPTTATRTSTVTRATTTTRTNTVTTPTTVIRTSTVIRPTTVTNTRTNTVTSVSVSIRPTTTTTTRVTTTTRATTATATSVTTATATDVTTETVPTTEIHSTTATETATVTTTREPSPTPTPESVCDAPCTKFCQQLEDRPRPDTDDCLELADAISKIAGQISPTFTVEADHVQVISYGTCQFSFGNTGPEPLSYCWDSLAQFANEAIGDCLVPHPDAYASDCTAEDGIWRIGVEHSVSH